MRFMKWAVLAVTVFFCLFSSPTTHAIGVSPPPQEPNKTDSPIIITGYAFHGPELYYVQLFNLSNTVIDVSDWSIHYAVSGVNDTIGLPKLKGLIKLAAMW